MNTNTPRNKIKVVPLVPIVIPPPHDFKSRTLWEEAVWQIIVSYLVTIRKTEEMKSLLELLLSSHERSQVIRRITAIHRIAGGHSYRTIGKELWLTNQTISSIKKAWEGKHYRSYHERGKTERKKKIYSPVSSSKSYKDPSVRTRRTKFGTIKGV